MGVSRVRGTGQGWKIRKERENYNTATVPLMFPAAQRYSFKAKDTWPCESPQYITSLSVVIVESSG